jgi:hypothetical protein
MDAELQAIPGMDQTAFFAVWERLLRAFTRGGLSTPVNLHQLFIPDSSGVKLGMTRVAGTHRPWAMLSYPFR